MQRRGMMMGCYKEQDMPVASHIRVPFLWENSPGVSKVSGTGKTTVKVQPNKLPPPPKRVTPLHEVHVTGHGNKLRSPFHYAVAVRDGGKPGDPFLAAYIKCTTASPVVVPRSGAGKCKGIKARLRRYLLKLSCRYTGSSNVRDDTLLPKPRHEKSRN